MAAYIDIVGVAESIVGVGKANPMPPVLTRIELTDSDLHGMGEFTRKNVERWLMNGNCQNVGDGIGLLPAQDFRAVCGTVEIPWATEEGRSEWKYWSHPKPYVSRSNRGECNCAVCCENRRLNPEFDEGF